MAQRPNNLPLIVVAVCAAGVLLGINVMQNNSDPVIREKMAKEAEHEAAKKESEKTKNAPQQAPPAEVAPGANDVAGWGAEKTFGQPNGKPSVTVAWEWTPAVQGNPSSIFSIVEAVKKAYPAAAIHVVNLDAKPSAAKPGISVDGTLRIPPAPDGTFPQDGGALAALQAAH